MLLPPLPKTYRNGKLHCQLICFFRILSLESFRKKDVQYKSIIQNTLWQRQRACNSFVVISTRFFLQGFQETFNIGEMNSCLPQCQINYEGAVPFAVSR